LHNKPLGYGASEVYASGPACEEEEGRAQDKVGPMVDPYKACETSGPHGRDVGRLGLLTSGI